MSRLKLGVAAGTLGVGVATLALVGTGTFAQFTDAAVSHNTVTAGTFTLRAVPDTSSCRIGSNLNTVTHFTATTPIAINSTVTAGSIQSTGANGSTPTHTVSTDVSNADPGRIYTCQFTVFDVGTLPGHITSITYAAPGQTNSNAYLLQGMKVGIELVPANGATPWFATSSGNKLIPAASNATFTAITAGGNSFLQPNPTLTPNRGNSNEGNWGLRIVMTVPASLTNRAQGETVTGMTFTVTGTNI